MKKILSLLLALILVLNLGITANAAGDTHTLTMTTEATAAAVGDYVYVTIGSEEAISSVGIEVKVYYDKETLELDKDKSTLGDAFGYFNLGEPKDTYVPVSFFSPTIPMSVSAGTYYTLAFQALKEGNTTVSMAASVYGANSTTKLTAVTTDTAAFTVSTPVVTGYTVSASEDVTATVNGSAQVKVNVTGHSETNITTYNDYDVTVSYDTAKLTYAGAAAADATATITPDTATGTIRITGHGTAKAFSTAVATLNFTANTSGNANVKITSAKIDNSGNAISANAPEAYKSDDTTVIKVAYPVTLPTGFTGNPSVLPGESYTFTAPNEYYNVTVTVGGATVTPTVSGTSYTITNVNGAVEVTATGKTYTVTVADTTATVEAGKTATYGTDYTFKVTPSANKQIDKVTVTLADGTPVNCTLNATGAYVIEGTDITGALTITVTEKDAGTTPDPETTTSVTISGITADEIDGGSLTLNATNGEDYQFTVIPENGYTYTAEINGTTLESTVDEETGHITFTIPGEMIDGTALTVTITKTAVSTGTLNVEVTQYIQLDDKAMFLITAADGDKVLAYGEDTMYWSDKYTVGENAEAGAYCWLVVSADSIDNVKATAVAAIQEAGEGKAAATIAYDFDVNQTTVVDINDAQLTYDMYSGIYEDFTSVTMDKFLEADLNGSKTVTVEDASAIVNSILGSTG